MNIYNAGESNNKRIKGLIIYQLFYCQSYIDLLFVFADVVLDVVLGDGGAAGHPGLPQTDLESSLEVSQNGGQDLV